MRQVGDSKDDGATNPTKRLMSRYDVTATVILVAVWLIPITLAGGFKKSISTLPAYMRDLQRIACLFTKEASSWPTYHIQIQTSGSNKWKELNVEGYYDTDTFGYRLRIERILSHSYRRGGGRGRMREIADFTRERYEQRNPDGPKLNAVRFVQVKHPIRALAKQTGHFVREPLSRYPKNWQTPFGERRYDGKRPSVDHRGKKIKRREPRRGKSKQGAR